MQGPGPLPQMPKVLTPDYVPMNHPAPKRSRITLSVGTSTLRSNRGGETTLFTDRGMHMSADRVIALHAEIRRQSASVPDPLPVPVVTVDRGNHPTQRGRPGAFWMIDRDPSGIQPADHSVVHQDSGRGGVGLLIG